MNEQSQRTLGSQNSPKGKELLYQSDLDGESDYSGYALTAPDGKNVGRTVTQVRNPAVSWEASEYIHHTKNANWFIFFFLIMLVLGVLAVLTGAWTFVAVVIAMTVAIAVVARRPPRVLHYSLSHDGLQIDDKLYPLNEFRAFGILHDGAFYSIMLIPSKRFMPAVTIYFDEKDGEEIVDILGSYLPMEHLEQDFLDKLMRSLRF